MNYPVALTRTEEGYSVSCPGLPGCWSQGTTEEEALSNIRDAIQEYLEVARQLAGEPDSHGIEIPTRQTHRRDRCRANSDDTEAQPGRCADSAISCSSGPAQPRTFYAAVRRIVVGTC